MLTAATKRMIDLSTAHMTEKDSELLFEQIEIQQDGFPRMAYHEYGFILFVSSDEFDVSLKVNAMKNEGYSPEFIAIYEMAAKLGQDVMLINFDRDADVIDGLPTFEW